MKINQILTKIMLFSTLLAPISSAQASFLSMFAQLPKPSAHISDNKIISSGICVMTLMGALWGFNWVRNYYFNDNDLKHKFKQAIYSNNVEQLKWLKYFVPSDIQKWYLEQAIHPTADARQQFDLERVKTLIECGMLIKHKDIISSLLIRAIYDNDGKILQLLLENAVNINYQDYSTALCHAAFNNNIECVRVAINGADIRIKDSEGRTAYDCALNIKDIKARKAICDLFELTMQKNRDDLKRILRQPNTPLPTEINDHIAQYVFPKFNNSYVDKPNELVAK